jgi:hypothetical protein
MAIQLEAGRRNPDNCVSRAIVKKPHPKDVRVSAVTLLPQTCADDRDWGRAGSIVRSFERAASQQWNSQYRKQL